jgi:hypothetical protein
VRYCENFFFVVFLISTVSTIGVCFTPCRSFSQDFQNVPIILKTSEIIPAQWWKGPNYTIRGRVSSDGVISTYELDTLYGPLTVESTVLLLKRMHELRALHRMEELQDSDVFTAAAKGAVAGTFYTARDLIGDFPGTISAVGGGINRIYKGLTSSASNNDSYHPSAWSSTLGQAATKREFAYKFGVDPYSSYLPLQQMLDSIAWTATRGSLTVKTAFSVLSLIPGGVGVVVSLTSTADSLRSLVRDKTPSELMEINARKLSSMGVSDSVAKIFLNNVNYNPSEQTLLVGELANMKTVKDRVMFIVAACHARNEQMALFMRVIAQLIGFYNEKVESIYCIVKADSLPLLEKKDGTVVAILPLDHLAWTQRTADMERAVSEAIRKLPGITGKEFLVIGTVDQKAKKALESKGWKVGERFAEATIQEIVAKSMAE